MLRNNMLQPQPAQPFSNLITPMMPQGMIWAKGKGEAMNYPMARGTTLPIFDSEDDVFYVKAVDVYGNTQPLRTFKYEELTSQTDDTQSSSTSQVSLEEFNSLKSEIEELKEVLVKMTAQNNSNDNRKPYRKESRNNG